MTTCYFVSDLHGSEDKYKLLAREVIRNKPSFLFLGGDLLPHVRYSDKQKDNVASPFFKDFLFPLFQSMQKQMGCNYPEVFVIAGNDDYKTDIPGFEQGVQKELWKFLNSNMVRFGPYHIYGYSYVPPTPFKIKDWEKYDIDDTIKPGCLSLDSGYRSVPTAPNDQKLIKDDIEMMVGQNSMDKAIFMFHCPPYDSLLDKIEGQVSIGSIAIRQFIDEMQPYITLHGHVHESASITGHWNQKFGRTNSFSAAYDGKELSLVIFQIDDPTHFERKLIAE
jgi:uncharacterized protein